MVREWFGRYWKHGIGVMLALVLGAQVTSRVTLAATVTSDNLVEDPTFESSDSGFYAQDYGFVGRTTDSPIAGVGSLRVATDGWGTTIWWSQVYSGHGTRLAVSARLRSDVDSASILNFCAIAYYDDWTTTEQCTPVDGSEGDKGTVSAAVTLDPERTLMWVNMRMFQEGSEPLSIMVDNADVRLDIVVADPPVPTSDNLIADPLFETGDSGFYPQDGGFIGRTAEAPLEGNGSLRLDTNGWGTAMWWTHDFGGKASRLFVAARMRSNVDSASILQFCAIVYYTDWSTAEQCTPVDGVAGEKGVVSAEVAVDPTRVVMWANIRMFQEGSEPLSMTLDNADARLDIVEPPPPPGSGASGGGSGGGNGGGNGGSGGDSGGNGGGSANTCAAAANSIYQPVTYSAPSSRPYLPLTAYTQGGPTSSSAVRLRNAVDAAMAGNPPYGFSPKMSLVAYRLTNNAAYLADAINRVEAMVVAAEAAIGNGQRPAVASDSYLEVGADVELIALVFDHAFDLLTIDQRARWKALADQAIYNVWHPADATWGGQPFPWSGWSICDPGNNYHFSFLRATMSWAWASQDQALLDFLQTQKFPPLLDYYAALPGGGTREGTGYGAAIGNLIDVYRFWKDATGQDLAAITPHPADTIDYWVHATVPTRDRFAPIGDLSRESIPNLYDYHENLVHGAVVVSAGLPQARRGTWWLQNNSVTGVAHVFNILGDLLPYSDPPEQPAALMFHSPGAGALFARTSWDTEATWMAVVAGKYDQSHAHHDQGSFTFFKKDWLAVNQNIWSHSGLHLEDEVHNVIRFERADGSVIAQNPSDTVAASMTATVNGTTTSVTANLANAYSSNAALIENWTRSFELSDNTLTVTDTCVVAAGVKPVFQLQVPAAPVLQQDGSIVAGNLRVVSLLPVAIAFQEMNGAEFSRGHRIEMRSATGCVFSVSLEAMEGSTDPGPMPLPGPGPAPAPAPTPAPGNAAPAPIPTSIINATDPIQPLWSEAGPATARIKSPGQHMRFTAGAPLRILADARDPNSWMCPPGHPPYVCPGSLVRFYVDGQLAGTATPSATDANLWELRLNGGLPAGDHVLTVSFVPFDPNSGAGGASVAGLTPVTIHVDPLPEHANTISLSADMVLSGSTDLNWSDAIVIGNGFRVTAASGYSGNVVVNNAMITGLGSYTATGIDIVTSGSVAIDNTIFEATGAVRLGVQGSQPFRLRNNELRSNNLVTFVASNPDVPVMLELVGDTSGEKSFTGNRLGAGILRIRGNAWQIGGLAAGEGNVLIGPRVVLDLVDSQNAVIQGNYLRHDYHGGFSQGFNLAMWGSSDHALIEHNVIRGGSWPVQNVGGEFRYNLVADSGHNFWRGARSNASIHHNVFAHTSGVNTGFEGVFKFYGGETGITIHSNTFDVAGQVTGFDGPVINIGGASRIASLRNNLFTGFRNVSGFGNALVSAPEGAASTPRIDRADFNAWFNPLAGSAARYLVGLVANPAGANDVTGNPSLAGAAELPYRIAEGCIWVGNCTTGQVLAHYRTMYQPSGTSPLLDAGDPSDGAGTPIGAIGRAASTVDRFGRIVP